MAKEFVPPIEPEKELPPVETPPVEDVAPVKEELPPVETPAPTPVPAPVDVSEPPAVIEERAKNEAWSQAILRAEASVAGRVKQKQDEAKESLIQAGKSEQDAEAEVASMPISFNVQAEIRRAAMAEVVQYVMIDTPDGKPLRLNDMVTIEPGDWEIVDANSLEQLRSMEDMGYCKAIIRPPGWEPKRRA